MLHYCILLVFAISFFLQQVQAFFVPNRNSSSSAGKSEFVYKKLAIGNTCSSVAEFVPAPELMDMEFELAEEDETDNNQEETFGITEKYALHEFKYTCSLQSLYLHLNSSVHQQNLVPFFILYHSWKDDINALTIS